MRYALLLSFALTACQSSPEPDASGLGARSVDELPDPSMIEDVSVAQTTNLLAGGLRSVSPSAAIQTIDLWISRLDTVPADGASEVREDLDELRDLLQSSPLDGRSIGNQIKEVAESTEALSDSAYQLSGLVSLLRAAGRQLAPDSTVTRADSASVQR